MYCKHQGHLKQVCNVKQRDDEEKKRKYIEKIKNNPASDQVIQQSISSTTYTINVVVIDAVQMNQQKDKKQRKRSCLPG